MNPLDHFNQEIVTLIKQDGTIKKIKALVHAKKIITDNVENPIDEGDIITRTLPNGKTESYKVINPVFHKAFYGVPDNYQIEVAKTTTPQKNAEIYINASDNAKVMLSSVDNSINIDLNKTKIFDELLKIVQTLPNNNNLITAIQNMKESVNDKESFKNKYNEFIQIAASHMTVLAPFLPALTNFLL